MQFILIETAYPVATYEQTVVAAAQLAALSQGIAEVFVGAPEGDHHKNGNVVFALEDEAALLDVLQGYYDAFYQHPGWADGGDPETAAREWIAVGFSASECGEWLDAGCFRAEAARELADAGLEPRQAATPYDDGDSSLSYGHRVANGDMSAERAAELLGVA